MIVIEKITAHSGQFALKDTSFVVPTGTYGMLMGRTGSGKTTILEAIAGLKPVTGGRILLGGRNVTGLKPAERNIGYVPQDGALFSTMTVREHLSFALDIRRVPRPQIDERVAELAELLEIEDLLHRLPRGLSGGEKQRVAIGRALAFRPSTLLLDEPLSALDDETRNQLYSLLKHVQEHTGVTTLHVTHHMHDVERLADKLFRIDDGVVTEQPVNGKPITTKQS